MLVMFMIWKLIFEYSLSTWEKTCSQCTHWSILDISDGRLTYSLVHTCWLTPHYWGSKAYMLGKATSWETRHRGCLSLARGIQANRQIHTCIHTHRQFRVSFTWPSYLWAVGGNKRSCRKQIQTHWRHTNTQAQTEWDRNKTNLILWNLTSVQWSFKKGWEAWSLSLLFTLAKYSFLCMPRM